MSYTIDVRNLNKRPTQEPDDGIPYNTKTGRPIVKMRVTYLNDLGTLCEPADVEWRIPSDAYDDTEFGNALEARSKADRREVRLVDNGPGGRLDQPD